jgi:hypothetical protein
MSKGTRSGLCHEEDSPPFRAERVINGSVYKELEDVRKLRREDVHEDVDGEVGSGRRTLQDQVGGDGPGEPAKV